MLIFILLFSLWGCTDAEYQSRVTLGKSAKITCWTGGKLFLMMDSTGKIERSIFGNYFYFKDNLTSDYIEVSGDCLIAYQGFKRKPDKLGKPLN